MGKLFCAVAALCIASFCNGLEVNLTADPSTNSCYLYCSANSPFNLDDVGGPLTFSSISSLMLFKKEPAIPIADARATGDSVLAFLDSTQPNIIHEAEGLSIVGRLDVEGASFQMRLSSGRGCKSEYTCRAEGLDFHGRELISNGTAALQSEEEETNAGDQEVGRTKEPGDGNSTSESGVLLQLLALIQQLDKDVAMLTVKMDGFKAKVSSLEKTVGYEVISVETRLKNKTNSLKTKLDHLENEMKNKDTGNGSFIVDNVCQLEVKISREDVQDGSGEGSAILNSLDELRREIEVYQNGSHEAAAINALKNTEMMEMTMNSTSALLASIENIISQSQTSGQEEALMANLTETITEALASEELEVLGNISLPGNDTCTSSLELLESIKQLETVLSTNGQDLHDSLSNLTSEINDMVESKVKSVASEVIAPKRCEKGMMPAIAQSPYPYPVVYPNDESSYDFPVLCDSVTDDGGWIIIQRRTTGAVDFNRKWDDYKQGFGNLDSDFWLGNEKLHKMTKMDKYELWVDISYKDKKGYAFYYPFAILNEEEKYKLLIGSYVRGTAGDSMNLHHDMMFSTVDNDNDKNKQNCAQLHGGGWWFESCDLANLNGHWAKGGDQGLEWTSFVKAQSLTSSEMKIRKIPT